ncbi:cytochrome P450, family 4, subfamily B, polypeptide 1 L homeolog [Xenopus laevis]|uniref:Cytochrome P450, family 4, subfamily B, polypeptide 1 L homeolog n=2 Tax=Xenopus laevis TaxID=8355 RepID=Q5XG47_XENLA|nr:cytochrome P450, family 4, subfamily B, polypeptide 1 L homeolog [Xenopus laevis]AAH84618.1 LOC100036772 protein [Xenopus laevis]
MANEAVLGSMWNALVWQQVAALLCLLAVLLKATQIYLSKKRQERILEQFPGPPRHWLLGNVDQIRRDGKDLDLLVNWTQSHGGAYPVWFGNFSSFLFLTHPDYAKVIFGREEPKSSLSYNFLVPWIGNGLLVLTGPKWFQHRRLLTPGFHYDVLKPYVKLISKCTTDMLDNWEKRITKQKTVELFQHVSLMTLDSIMKCAFSYESNCQKDSDNAYIKAVFDLSYLANLRLRCFPYHNDTIFYLSPHGYRFRQACKITHEHTDKVIQQRKESMKHEKELEKIQQKRHLDFLDILLFARDEKGHGLSDEDLRAEVDTFMFEGHDTTASGISWILYCMAKYPEHQQKCREEIKEVLGDRQTMEWEDLGKIPYTNMCIKESLRIYPPVPGVARMLRNPVTFFDGRSIPAGTLVGLSIYAIHKNPAVWEDPEVFNPLRFTPENSANRHSHAFVPFAAGPRNCIGQNFAMNEMKIAVALTLNRFHLAADLENPPILIPQLVLKSKNGIHVHLNKVQ